MGERTGRYRLAGLPIPVGCIRKVAFLSVQIGMDPSALTICLVYLNEAVSPLPVVFGIPPECLQRLLQPSGDLGWDKDVSNMSTLMIHLAMAFTQDAAYLPAI